MNRDDSLVERMNAIWGPPSVAAIEGQIRQLPLTGANLSALIDAVRDFAGACALYGDSSEVVDALSDARGAAERMQTWEAA